MTEKIVTSPYRVDAIGPKSATTATGRSMPFRDFADILAEAEAVQDRVQVSRAAQLRMQPIGAATPHVLHDAVALLLRPLPWFMFGPVPRAKEMRRALPTLPGESDSEG
ncbi:MAG: hypothetical protein HY423_12870 [Candidatus Lambdaproteobacteria bacterium]|nr:hypothetical protein [Candidatus Lambdaproteobacteria bacterium]